ncbi:MAG: type IV pilus assembly protein PilM [Calditrichaeota bacterium]|nr:type IV pilus assembly protein PilM [Calditrichota bacterium]MCB9392011.1 type IV pilus assembly protein PilM [Calditrichota bacterium]
MFGLKSNLRVGLDIGSSAIKLVVAEKHGDRHKVIGALARDLYTAANEKYDLDGPKKGSVVPLVLDMFREAGVKPKRVAHLGSCLSGLNMATKEIRTLNMPDDEMASAINQEARKHLPLDGSESLVDYQVIGDDPREVDKLRVLIAVTTKRMFDAHLDVLRELELKPGVVDLEPLSCLNSYIARHELPDEGVICFLNVGARRTNLLIVGRKDMYFSRDLPVAGWSFTEDIMTRLNCTYSDAEEIKRRQGITAKDIKTVDASASGGSLAASLALSDKAPLEKMYDEINRSIRYYVKETGQSGIMKFILFGGSAASQDLCDYLAQRFSVPVESYDPFEIMDGNPSVSNPPQFATAVGLALRAHAIY